MVLHRSIGIFSIDTCLLVAQDIAWFFNLVYLNLKFQKIVRMCAWTALQIILGILLYTRVHVSFSLGESMRSGCALVTVHCTKKCCARTNIGGDRPCNHFEATRPFSTCSSAVNNHVKRGTSSTSGVIMR